MFGCGVVVSGGLLQAPLLGASFQALDSISVDRSSQAGREEAKARLHQRILSVSDPSASTVPLLVFAEGCTSTDDCLCNFRLGAFQPLQPVQPVFITYPGNSVDFYHGRGGGCALETLLYQASQLWCHQHVTILDAITPTSGETASQFAARVRMTMAAEMQLSETRVSDHSFADVQLHMAAREKGLPAPIFTALDCRQMLHLTVDDVKVAMDQFISVSSDRECDELVNECQRDDATAESFVVYLERIAQEKYRKEK